MSLLWKCARCEERKYHPADRGVICYPCQQPMERVAPKDIVDRQNPMFDFFNLYLSAKLRKEKACAPSMHKVYRNTLARNETFMRESGTKEPILKDYLDTIIQRYQRILKSATRYGIDLVHVYDQSLDLRSCVHPMTRGGWSQGVGAYWLKHMRQGVNLFPHRIYDDRELALPTSATLQLMEKLQTLGRQKAVSNLVGISAALNDIVAFVAGEDAARLTPLVGFSPWDGPDKAVEAAKLFRRSLPSEEASARLRGQELYAVEFRVAAGESHFVGLDMNRLEFFDPAYGVFAATERNRKQLIRFLFSGFLGICYEGTPMDEFKITKVA